jgi:hypothetical protein
MDTTCPCTGCHGCHEYRSRHPILYAEGDGNGGKKACEWETSKANKTTCHAECHWCTNAKVASLAAKNVPPLAIVDAVPAAPANLAAPGKDPEQAGLPAPPEAQAAPPAEPPAATVDNMGTQRFALLEQRVGVLEKHFNEMAPAALPQQ